MARYKTLRSVVNSVAQSFTSLMNWGDDDYVMGHVLTAARRRPAGKHKLSVDFLTGQCGPDYLLSPPVERSIAWYVKSFPDTVRRSASDMSLVREAKLALTFDTSIERPHRLFSYLMESPFTCEVTVIDDRGTPYAGQVSDWWFPERVRPLPMWVRLRNSWARWWKR